MEQSADVVTHHGHFIKSTQTGCYSWNVEGMEPQQFCSKPSAVLLQLHGPASLGTITIGFPVPRQAEGSCPGNSSGVCEGNPSMRLVLAVFALVHADVSRDMLKARGSSSFRSKRLWVSPYINGGLGISQILKSKPCQRLNLQSHTFQGHQNPEFLSRLMACPLDISRWMPASIEITALKGGWRNVAGSRPLLFPFYWKVVFSGALKPKINHCNPFANYTG